MKVLIAIPSKDRVDFLKRYSNTWVPLVGLPWIVFVEPHEYDEYIKFLPASHVVSLGESHKGTGYAKVAIAQYARATGFDAVFKVDDDIKGWTDFRTRLSPIESARMILRIIHAACMRMHDDPELVGISFPYSFQMFEKYDWKKTKRVQTCYLFRTEFFHADEHIGVFEDFAVGLNAIVKGKRVEMCGVTGMVLGAKVGIDAGGERVHYKRDNAPESIRRMQLMFPKLGIRNVEKPWLIEPDLRSVKGVGVY